MSLNSTKFLFCESYAINKAHRQHNKNPTRHRAKKFLKQIHMDLYGGGETLSTVDNHYFYILTDDTICWRDMFLLKTKAEMKLKLPH